MQILYQFFEIYLAYEENSMKSTAFYGTILVTFFLIFVSAAEAIELTRDNPQTIIYENSQNMSILGFKIGLTRDEAWDVINKNKEISGAFNPFNKSDIYIYKKSDNVDVFKDSAVLYLIWEDNNPGINRIIVYQAFMPELSKNFQKLLTFEALDNSSKFKTSFIGYENRIVIERDSAIIDDKQVDYYYDNIGLKIIHTRSLGTEKVYFALIHSKK